MVVDKVRYSRKEEIKKEKGSRVSVSKFHSLGLGNAYEPLLFDYTDFVITARSAAPIPDLLVLYTMLCLPEPFIQLHLQP